MINEHDFLSRFEGVQQSGGGWVARCPAHGDDNPSLSIARGEDGRWLVHCHAGCSAEAVVSAVGLKMCDLMPANEKPRRTIKGRWGDWVCDYVYTDAAGATLYKSSRYVKEDGKKTFIIKVPDPSAKFGWAFGLAKKKVMRVPFHLPRVIASAKAGKTIIICEGEKDVLSVEEVTGCAATCNVAGAMKWGYMFPEDWGKWFEGAKGVIIIADNDPKTKKVTKKVRGKTVEEEIEHLRGQKHACDVRRRLLDQGFSGKIKLMVMPQVEGQARVKDFTDWVEARRAAGLAADKAAFMEVIKTAAPWPEEWNFDSSALESEAKGEGNLGLSAGTITDVAAASERSEREESGGDALSFDERITGRFGRPVPRAPGEDPKEYLVDFDIGGGRFATIKLEYGWTVDRIFAQCVADVSSKCANNELPKGVPVRLKAWSATIWLLMRGSFFWHSDFRDFSTCMYLDRDKSSCTLMRVMSDEFYAFVARHARLEDVDPKKGDMAKILGLVKQIAVNEDYSRGVKPGNSWERRGKAIYISSGDTEMVRIKDGKVDKVQNGTDGVVFLRGKTLAPWDIAEGEELDPFTHAMIFTGASFADHNGLMNVRLWTMNLLACHPTKPPLLITGGAGSGKTRMAKGIKEILGMRQDGALDLSVQQIEDGDKGLDAFWATVNDGKLEVFDNFDTKVKWASDTLQTAATDGQTKRRTLYTTYGVSILKANASIILTSNNPIFSTEGNGGLADRLITVPLTMNRNVSQDSELSRQIAGNRSRYLTWIAKTLAKVMLDEKPVDASVNRRHPDYGEFSVRVGRAIGDEEGAVKALGAAEADKAMLPLMNDVVTKEIMAVLSDNAWTWSGTAGELSEAIISRQGDDGDDKTKTIFSSRRVGKALNKYLRQFSVIFRMDEPKLSEGRMRYRFSGRTALGSQSVGLVDFNGDSSKTSGRGSAHGFMENTAFNPPNPPGDSIRARAHSPLPSKEEDVERNMDREDYEDEDWPF
ncbi:MAG: hypothetical protein J6N18_03860 [Kiritimatiellae bacterium]|nr:hypothetical protein [Kiritimatiellia bacterium]